MHLADERSCRRRCASLSGRGATLGSREHTEVAGLRIERSSRMKAQATKRALPAKKRPWSKLGPWVAIQQMRRQQHSALVVAAEATPRGCTWRHVPPRCPPKRTRCFVASFLLTMVTSKTNSCERIVFSLATESCRGRGCWMRFRVCIGEKNAVKYTAKSILIGRMTT